MNTEKEKKTNKAKPPGTVLNGRYELYEPIGRGGFSIVYEAEDRQSGQKVAVKECTILSEKDRFLREAKLLEEYSEEDAIVRVLDFFEENDTAYIVMEFLEGENLRECIEKNGKWTMEETVQQMAPVMETLEHMHRNNVIHRDISPDNIMVLKDGNLKLLDFGAAKQYEDSTLSRLVVKASYSPPEQMDAKGMFGSWSDVYSICAAMYFCITGKNPEDAISRLMMDDLKKPSEHGADILPAAEKTLMSGMALDSSKRIQGMAQLRKDLEKTYPILTEEERIALRRKKRIRKLSIAAAVCIIAIGLLGLANAQKIRKFIHNRIGTEVIMFDGSHMSKESFQENAERAQSRIAAFSGGHYKIEIKDQRIIFELPAYLFGGENSEKCMELLGSSSIRYVAFNEKVVPEAEILPGEDIGRIYEKEGKLNIEFTEKGAEKLREQLNANNKPFVLMPWFFEWNRPSAGFCKFPLLGTADGKTAVFFNDSKQQTNEYVAQALSTDSYTDDFIVKRKWDIRWDDKTENNTEEQPEIIGNKNPKEEKLRLKYIVDKNDTNRSDSKLKKKKIERLKKRMESLDVPYSIGYDNYDDSIVIELPRGSINHETAEVLGIFFDKSMFGMGSETVIQKTEFENANQFIELKTESSHPHFVVAVNSPEASDEIRRTHATSMVIIQNNLEKMKSEGVKDYYLYFENIPIAKTDVETALDSIIQKRDIVFNEWCSPSGKTKEVEEFSEFIAESIMQSSEEADKYGEDNARVDYILDDIQLVDKEDTPLWEEWSGKDAIFNSEITAFKYADAWNKNYKDKFIIRLEQDSDNAHIVGNPVIYNLSLSSHIDSLVKVFMQDLSSFYKDNIQELENGTFKNMTFMSYTGMLYVIIASTDVSEGYVAGSVGTIGDDFVENSGQIENEMVDLMKNDETLTHLITNLTNISKY